MKLLDREVLQPRSVRREHVARGAQRRAVLALKPVDEAGARYELAVALRDAGSRDEARREVLRALEIAPSFEKAQTLLLELRGGGQSP